MAEPQVRIIVESWVFVKQNFETTDDTDGHRFLKDFATEIIENSEN